MSASKKSIDEIWKELNARPAPRQQKASSSVGSEPGTSAKGTSITIPGLGVIKRVPPPPKISQITEPMVEDVPIGGANSSAGSVGPTHKMSNYDPSQAGVSSDEYGAYLASIQRLVNCLSDQDRSIRRQAAVTLQTKLVTGDASTAAASPAMLQALMSGPLMYPLLTMLRDIVEKCRVVSMELWCHAVFKVPDVSAMLPNILPELAKRMGHLPVQEQAEEIRLSLVQLVASLLSRQPPLPGTLLGPALPDIMLIMSRAQEDGYHEIKKAGCAALVSMCNIRPPLPLSSHTAKLIVSLVVNLTHPHSRVRVATLEALDGLVTSDALPAGSLKDTVAPALRPVAYDRAPNVREALFRCLGTWLGAKPVHVDGSAADTSQTQAQFVPGQDHMTELLPILLVGVSDPQEAVAAVALDLVEQVGTAYTACASMSVPDSNKQSGDTDMALADGAQVSSTPQDTDMQDAAGETAASSNSSSDAQNDLAVAACRLGAPYKGRPCEGSRLMARALLPHMLPPVISDLTAWTVSQRAAAVRSLHTLLVLAEDAAQGHLPHLLPALCSAVGDEDGDIAAGVVRCAHVVGAHVPAARWLPLMLDTIINTRLTAAARTNSLVLLTSLMYAAGQAKQPLSASLLHSLASHLASDDLRGTLLVASVPAAAGSAALPATANAGNATPAVTLATREASAARSQLLAACSNLITWQGSALSDSNVRQHVCVLLLALWGAETDSTGSAVPAPVSVTLGTATSTGLVRPPSPRDAVESAMSSVVENCGFTTWGQLLDTHADGLLQEQLKVVETWVPDAGGFLVLKALLLTSSSTTLSRLAQPLFTALKPILSDHDGNAPIRLAILQLVDAVLDDDTGKGKGLAIDDAHTSMLLTSLLLPPLTWRAGKTAAAVRYAAVTALESALRRGLLPAKSVMRLVNDGTLLPLLSQELDEDWYVDVRSAACSVARLLLLLVGPQLGHEPRRTLYVELLKRLDDSSNKVRIAGCAALEAFCSTMQHNYCETNSGYLAGGVVIHMDDADTAVQDAACAVLESLAKVKPSVVRTEVAKVYERFRNKHCCDRVLQACT